MGYTADTNDMLLEYNNFNQLTTVTKGNDIVTYDYYANGMRKSKTVDGVTTTHIWDGQNMAGEITEDNFTGYLRGTRLIAVPAGENTQYYHFNGHGDVTTTTDMYGNIYHDYQYDAFGNLKNPYDWDYQSFRYCGEYYDVETGFIYLRARYYSPEIGRFISEDPVRDGLNWYAYCGNNPVMFVDPTGLWAASYTDANGVYHAEPDYEEFYGTIAYQALSDLTESYELSKTAEQREIIALLAEKVRKVGRVLGPWLTLYQGPADDAGYQLSATEIVLANGNYAGYACVLVAGKQASNLTVEKYGSAWGIGDEIDAYRHGVWSMLLAEYTNTEFATMWLNAHEFGTSDNLRDWDTEYGTTRYQQTEMDLFNNAVGIYQSSILNRTYEFRPDGYFPIPITEDVSNVISSRINAGGMVILNGN